MFKTTALLAVAALALAACGSSSKSTSGTSSTTAAAGAGYGSGASSSSTTKTTSASSGSAIALTANDNSFSPQVITGKAGTTVKVTFTNAGSHDHNFKIDSQKSANADVKPGKSATVSVKIPSSGSLQFYCEYHKALGMTGTVKPA